MSLHTTFNVAIFMEGLPSELVDQIFGWLDFRGGRMLMQCGKRYHTVGMMHRRPHNVCDSIAQLKLNLTLLPCMGYNGQWKTYPVPPTGRVVLIKGVPKKHGTWRVDEPMNHNIHYYAGKTTTEVFNEAGQAGDVWLCEKLLTDYQIVGAVNTSILSHPKVLKCWINNGYQCSMMRPMNTGSETE